MAALTPSAFIAALLNPFVVIVFALFCAVTIPKPEIPSFWRVWLYELVPFTRLVGGMVSAELHGRMVECTEREFNRVAAPVGQSCGDYMTRSRLVMSSTSRLASPLTTAGAIWASWPLLLAPI